MPTAWPKAAVLPIMLTAATQDSTTGERWDMATSDVDYTMVSAGMVSFVDPEAATGMPGRGGSDGHGRRTMADELHERSETFVVALTAQMPDYVTLGDPPVLTIADMSVDESDASITFTVSLADATGMPQGSGLPIVLNAVTEDSTTGTRWDRATATVDYAMVGAGMVSFQPDVDTGMPDGPGRGDRHRRWCCGRRASRAF